MPRHQLLFFTAILTLLACQAQAETALLNVTGYTSTESGLQRFDVLVFDDSGRIVATGDAAILEQHADAERIDGAGRTVLPGLIDAHAHILNYGLLQSQLNLFGSPTLEDATSRIETYAKERPLSLIHI